VISFISIAGVTLGVAALIVVLSVMTGFRDGVRQQILGNIPHVLVQRYGDSIENYQELVKASRELPEVTAASPFVSREAMLLSNRNVAAVSVKGVERSHKAFSQEMATLEGLTPEELVFDIERKLPGIVIPLDAANSLGVTVGDRVNVIPPLFTLSPFGMVPKMKPFQVVAVIHQRSTLMDTFYAYIALETAQSFFEEPGRATGIDLEVASYDQASGVARRLQQQFAFPTVVRSWEDLFGSFLSALRLEKLGLFIVLTIIVLVAAFNIATTLIMVVMEKHKDIAILRSMGATSRSITQIFVLEGLIIGVIGTGLGALSGLLLAWNADPLIKGLEGLLQVKIFDQAVYGLDTFPSIVDGSDVLMVVLVSLSICLLATVYPARRAAKMDPAEALRYE